jgi:hypothetical protein
MRQKLCGMKALILINPALEGNFLAVSPRRKTQVNA